jgi:hypothetical protein
MSILQFFLCSGVHSELIVDKFGTCIMAREAEARSLAADASTRYLVLNSMALNDSSNCHVGRDSFRCAT